MHLDTTVKRYLHQTKRHVSWSANPVAITFDPSTLNGKDIVVFEKMDGTDTSIYHNYMHSVGSATYEYTDNMRWLIEYYTKVTSNIGMNERVCGQNLYFVNSIVYGQLPSYFIATSVWHGGICLSWDSTVDRLTELSMHHPPIFYRGPYDDNVLRDLNDEKRGVMGYIVRPADSFTYNQYNQCVTACDYLDYTTTHGNVLYSGGEVNMLRSKI